MIAQHIGRSQSDKFTWIQFIGLAWPRLRNRSPLSGLSHLGGVENLADCLADRARLESLKRAQGNFVVQLT